MRDKSKLSEEGKRIIRDIGYHEACMQPRDLMIMMLELLINS